MAYERMDFDLLQGELEKERVRDNRSNLQAVQRSALAADQITGDEHWDHFLSILNARIEKLALEVEAAVESLKNSDNFNAENLIAQKLVVRLLGREIQALDWVIELPKVIMEQGADAKKLLGTIDESTH
jgi:hypothetical protein